MAKTEDEFSEFLTAVFFGFKWGCTFGLAVTPGIALAIFSAASYGAMPVAFGAAAAVLTGAGSTIAVRSAVRDLCPKKKPKTALDPR